MRLLVTGATGFIGSQLVRAARAHGHDVVATGLLNSAIEQQRADRLTAEGIALIDGSLRVPAFAKRLVQGCEAVVHLGAAWRTAGVPDSYFFDVNVEGTKLLLESCVRARVRRFVYGSTIAVYGSAGGLALSEDTPLAPDDAHGESKAAAERVVRSFGDRLEITIARIGETYGPEDLRLLKSFEAARRGLSPIVGDGRNLHQPIHVQDLVRALLLAAEQPAAKGETFVLAGPDPITSRDILKTISETMGVPARPLRLPLLPLAGAARVTASACKRLSIPLPRHMRRLEFFRKSASFRTDKARALLGFEPTIPFGEGVRDTFAWYRSAGYLQLPHERAAVSADVPLTTFADGRWRLSDILEYTNDAIIVWEMAGEGILYWNRAAERLYGFPRQQALGRTTHLLLHTQLEGGVDELEEKLSRYGVWIGQLRHRKLDGSSVLVDARLSLMARRDGRWLVLEVNRESATPAERLNLKTELDAHLAHIKRAATA